MRRHLLPLLLALPAVAIGQEAPMRIDVERVRPHVHVLSGFTNGNVLVLDTRDGTVLVDAQSARRVAALDSAIRALGVPPVRWVVNTHYHEDHTGGNAHFRAAGARVLAHRAAAREAAKDTVIAERDWHRTPLPAAAMPTDLFDDAHELPIGASRVVVRHPRQAHTGGDAVVWLPVENVLHTGDILEVGAPPFVDWWAGGSVDGMLAALDDMLGWANDSTAIVPGHGATSTRADLRRYRDMLATVQARVRRGLAEGTPRDALAVQAVAGYEDRLGGARLARQLGEQLVDGLRSR